MLPIHVIIENGAFAVRVMRACRERGLKTVFRTVTRDDRQGSAIAAFIAEELKAKKFAIIDDKTAYGEGLANEVEKKLKGSKVNVVGRERTTDKETDFKAILTKIKSRNPDVIFHGGMDATGGPMLKQAREPGIKAVFAFGDGACTDEMSRLAGQAAEGLVCSQAGLPKEVRQSTDALVCVQVAISPADACHRGTCGTRRPSRPAPSTNTESM